MQLNFTTGLAIFLAIQPAVARFCAFNAIECTLVAAVLSGVPRLTAAVPILKMAMATFNLQNVSPRLNGSVVTSAVN
ncbi:hypothetical protein ColLi_03337 [Colletotrichum liriopes]|uniref:Secreted protein n=1 Tax=Colletotrichum liriopes TaxID=708192 RepID=A0AA37LPW0_9PEZI|nr:hypothetical protein ColLi_03337 [Colletotrichum liriopes]